MIKKPFLLLFIFSISVLNGCTQQPSEGDILGVEAINKFEELNEVDRAIQFPTYVPFSVNEVNLELEYFGPEKVEDGQIIHLEKGNPKYQVIRSIYDSEEEPKVIMEVKQFDSSILSLESFSHFNEDDLVDFGQGLKGLYNYNGFAHMFSWEEDNVTYEITISNNSHESNEGDIIPKEEIIKIAESFVMYEFK